MELSNQEILADMLINARNEKGYSQRELSRLTGVSNTEISKLEKGERLKPQPTILKKLANALNLDYEEMLEAVGYIGSIEFDDNRFLLDEDEKHFIVDAIIEKFQLSDQNVRLLFENHDDVYKMFFRSKDTQETSTAIPSELLGLVETVVKKGSESQVKKFTNLCRWFADSESKD